MYVRVGSTNRQADTELIEELRRYAHGEPYDEQPMPDLDSEAVDFRAASESFAPVRKFRRADLETLRLVTSHQWRTVPTVGCILLFGHDRKLHKHSLRGAEIGPVRRTDLWSIPPVAVCEAVINAVAHADYRQRGAPIRVAIFDDRLEVENPGLLPFGLTVEDLHRGVSKLRNRVIGRVFHTFGLIEQWGSGIQRMTTACRDAGLAAPILEEIGTRFRVTLSTTRITTPTLDEKDQAILNALADAVDGLSTSEIAKVVALSTRATRTRLAGLAGRGLVREVGTSPQDPKLRYFRTDQQL